MTDQATTLTSSSHPSPARDEVATGWLMFGVFAGPIAWSAQFVANYMLAVDPCFLTSVARTAPVLKLGSDWPGILIVNLVAALISIAGGAVSFQEAKCFLKD